MHRCLLIQDILQIIFEDVSAFPRHDWLAVALVCHRFYCASLAALWHKVPNFFPVLQCLPSDVWRVPLNRRRIADAKLARAITPTDLARFRIYAHHVRVFEDDQHADIPVDIYHALTFALQGQPIFPNLVELELVEVVEHPYTIMLLGPHLAGSPAQTSLLPYFPEESLQAVAGLPQLLDLALTEVNSAFEDSFSPTLGSPVFPALRKLSMSAETLTFCVNLLRAAKNRPLGSFSFYLRSASALNWHDLFSALAESCNKATLTSVFIQSSTVDGLGATEQLQPLLSLTNLTAVVLHYGFDIDDTFVREMAIAWPHLRCLHIGTFKMPRVPLEQQRLTLQGLASLAKYCPDLEILSVHVNATHSCFNRIDLGSNPSTSRLESITVSRSPISQSSVSWVAAYLSEVFPKLREIIWLDPHYSESEESLAYPSRWSEVMNHLAAYQHSGAGSNH